MQQIRPETTYKKLNPDFYELVYKDIYKAYIASGSF